MRAFWTGSIAFGLVNIPVRLYSAVESNELRFHYLHKEDLSPIRFARICREEEKEVPYKDLVKGYEYRKGQYVVMTNDDFRNAAPEATKTIEVVSFVDESEVDMIYADQPYYLEPDKRAGHPYALLRKVLEDSGKVAIVQYVLRSRGNIGVLKPRGHVLMLEQLRYQHEIRDYGELATPGEKELTKREVDMAKAVVDQLTGKFEPEKYKDTYTTLLHEAIEKKLKGKPLAAKRPAEHAKVYDLMDALRASLDQKGPPAKKKPRTKKTASRKVKRAA